MPSRLVPWLFAGVTLAGLVHIVSIFAMPMLSRNDATTRLTALAPANGFALLSRSRAGAGPLPFLDPNAVLGICPYALGEGPLRIRVTPGRHYLTVTFLGAGGSVFYSLSDRANPGGILDIRLVSAAQLRRIEGDDPDDEPVTELRVTAAQERGVVLISAITSEAADWPEAEQRLARTTCRSEPL